MDVAYDEFLRAFPTYAQTLDVDRLRSSDYPQLGVLDHVYLDHTGGGLFADSQLRAHLDVLTRTVYGNPHSDSRPSRASTDLVEQARAAVLDHFDAPADEYCVVFTHNASGALRLVGESFPFARGSRYLLTFDNHNSVNGIREFARTKGAAISYCPVVPPDLRLDDVQLEARLASANGSAPKLFAYPAQSNFSGVQHSLGWIARAQAYGWTVLLDAAAFVPTNRLDLRRWRPDFVTLSFYKMFGYPTGVGALIARRSALTSLLRPWYAGGTVTIASVQGDGHYLTEGEAGFEDGTVDYLGIPAVEIGLRHLADVGLDVVHERVRCLTAWLLDGLGSLRHRDGTPAVVVYGPTTTDRRGGTVSLNFLDPAGRVIDHRVVERHANDAGISLRSGCFCNPGGFENALNLTEADVSEYFGLDRSMTRAQFIEAMGEKDIDGLGAIRVSLGVVSDFGDVQRFVCFARTFVGC